MSKVRVELWCIQEDALVAEVVVAEGAELSAAAIKTGIWNPDHKRVPAGKDVRDGQLLLCRACTNPLMFFSGGTEKIEVPAESLILLQPVQVKLVYQFACDVEPQEGTRLGSWARTKTEVNRGITSRVGVVVEDDISKDILTLEIRNSFAAVPGMGRVG